VEKEALESHSWKQGKASTSSTTTAPQNKANPSPVASSTKNPSLKLSPSPAPKKQSNTPQVDLSSKLASNSKLTSNEHKKCLKNNLCLYYSTKDYKLDFCPKKQTTVFLKSHCYDGYIKDVAWTRVKGMMSMIGCAEVVSVSASCSRYYSLT